MLFIVNAIDKAMVIAMMNITFRNPMALPVARDLKDSEGEIWRGRENNYMFVC